MPNIDQVQLPDGSQYNLRDNISGYVTAQYVNDAIDGLTKADVGLGNVDNTSDLNKPVSTAQQTALNGKTDTTVIAPTEATTTASRRYEIGEQFILNGVLYTATAVIASGDTIIVDTNCELSESITEQIEGKAKKTDLTSISESGTTASQAISAGTLFYLNGILVEAKVDIASGATFTLNTNYEVTTVEDAITPKDITSSVSRNVTFSELFVSKMNKMIIVTFRLSNTSGSTWVNNPVATGFPTPINSAAGRPWATLASGTAYISNNSLVVNLPNNVEGGCTLAYFTS